ncbi:MAG: hypothetical protein Q8P67_22565 [archaeon]|nr:hypothetical protein [archaeon]
MTIERKRRKKEEDRRRKSQKSRERERERESESKNKKIQCITGFVFHKKMMVEKRRLLDAKLLRRTSVLVRSVERHVLVKTRAFISEDKKIKMSE